MVHQIERLQALLAERSNGVNGKPEVPAKVHENGVRDVPSYHEKRDHLDLEAATKQLVALENIYAQQKEELLKYRESCSKLARENAEVSSSKLF